MTFLNGKHLRGGHVPLFLSTSKDRQRAELTSQELLLHGNLDSAPAITNPTLPFTSFDTNFGFGDNSIVPSLQSV